MSHVCLTNSTFTTEIIDTGKAKQKETSENMDSAGIQRCKTVLQYLRIKYLEIVNDMRILIFSQSTS